MVDDVVATASRPRTAVLVGPQMVGKTALFEALLEAAGTSARKHRKGGERPATHSMTAAACTFLGEAWTLIDTPGAIDFSYEAQAALAAADLAIVVVEPVLERASGAAGLLKFLDDRAIPHMIVVNRMDQAAIHMRDLIAALQPWSSRKLVLRQVPIREGDQVKGYVDLVSERAYRWRTGQASDQIALPDWMRPREEEARSALVEALADLDDALLEKLLEEDTPSQAELYAALKADVRSDSLVPVLLTAAELDHGVRRLWKALRHDTPDAKDTCERLSLDSDQVVLQVIKTNHQAHGGKQSLVRVWSGVAREGLVLNGQRIGTLTRPGSGAKVAEARAGDVVIAARLDQVMTGQVLAAEPVGIDFPVPPAPVYTLAIGAENRADDVKLSTALRKLVEEDLSLSVQHAEETGDTLLSGQGELHLKHALEVMRSAFGVAVASRTPRVAGKETIRKGKTLHHRHKRQTGGHGQFADIHLEIHPLPRGSGFRFSDRIVGGAVPKQYIPAVEEGVREALVKGPMGYPVVDVEVVLTDGQYHAVDSSDMAFRTCARSAVQDALAECEPLVLEPIHKVIITAPSEDTPKVQRLVSGRRGQILGFDARPGWAGWDQVEALMPEAEMADMIIDLRSLTQGLGSFTHVMDHLAEARGKMAAKAA
ncbi:MAG: elongation factor G [Alphaproteobacteria bacterium]|nr:elongation factor G [Alphaproteobacteria bacterium]